MGASVRPESGGDRISRNVAALRAQGATEHDVEAYLTQHEGLKPEAPSSAAPRGGLYNAINTVDDALTFGAGKKINSAVNAASDVLRGRDSFSHSYRANLDAENAGLEGLRKEHPYVAGTLGAVGNVGQAAALAPLVAGNAITAGASMGSKMLTGAKAAAPFGALAGVANAPSDASPLSTLLRAGAGAAGAAVIGAGAVPFIEGVGAAGRSIGDAASSRAPKNVPARSAAIAGAEASSGAAQLPQSVDRGSRLLINRLQRTGLTPSDALARLEQMPEGKPVSLMEVAGENSHPLRQLGKLVARTPSGGAAELRANVAQRSDPLTNAKRVLGDVSEATGGPRTDLVQNAAALKGRQLGKAQPLYQSAMESPPVPHDFRLDEESPALSDLFKRPSIRQAIAFHNEVAAERGEPGITLPGAPKAEGKIPPGFTRESWDEVLRSAKERGIEIPEEFSARSGGKLQRDLRAVSSDDLEEEWRRLAEQNASEEGSHAGVQDSGYRMDYEELPKTEKRGHKGKEDLPDADGAVDPERLLADNKTVAGYNKNQIIRASRAKAMGRIQKEIESRAPASEGDDSFDFGLNATGKTPFDGGEGVSLKSLQQIKFKLDDMLGFAKRHGKLPDGSAATNAKMGAINDTRKQLLDIMNAHSPDYAEGNRVYAGEAAIQNAGDAGRNFLSRPIDELNAEFQGFTPGERAQHNLTAVNAPLRDRIFKTNAVDRAKILQSPDMQERLGVIASPERMATLNRNAGIEHQIAMTNQQIPGGSDTAENMLNQMDAGATPLEQGVKSLLSGGPRKAAGHLLKQALESRIAARIQGVNEGTANTLAPRLSAGMKSREDLQKELQRLMFQQALLEQLQPNVSRLGATAGVATGAAFPRR